MTDSQTVAKPLNPALHWITLVFGFAAGAAGLEHGVFEILQGPTRPASVAIASIGAPCVPEQAWNACEPAMTLLPTFQIAGIVTVILSLLLLVWLFGFVRRPYGGLILLGLTILMLLAGGGFAPPLIGIFASIAAGRVDKPLLRWQARSNGLITRLLAGLWPWALIYFIAWLIGQWFIGYFFNAWLLANAWLIVVSVLGGMLLSFFSAFAHDARRTA